MTAHAQTAQTRRSSPEGALPEERRRGSLALPGTLSWRGKVSRRPRTRWFLLAAMPLALALSCGVDYPLSPTGGGGGGGGSVSSCVYVQATVSNAEGVATITHCRMTLDGQLHAYDLDIRFDPPLASVRESGQWHPARGRGPHRLAISILGQTISPSTYIVNNIEVSLYQDTDGDSWWTGGNLIATKSLPSQTASLATGQVFEIPFTL